MIQNNTKRWINTSVEYQWDDELNELVQVSKEGYWYEGEMVLCMPTHNAPVTIGTDTNYGGCITMKSQSDDLSAACFLFQGKDENTNWLGVGLDSNNNFGFLPYTTSRNGGAGGWFHDFSLNQLTGNVSIGMGTALAGEALEVARSDMESAIEVSTWSTTDGHVARLRLQKSSSATVNTLAVTADDEALGDILFAGVHTGSARANAAQIVCQQDAAADGDSTPGRLILSTSSTSGLQEAIRIDSSQNVGIGTTTPGSVDTGVQGNSNRTWLSMNEASAECMFTMNRASAVANDDVMGKILFSADADTSSHKIKCGIRGVVSGTTANQEGGALSFLIKGDASAAFPTEKMRIDQNGNVGIGSAAPAYKLDIVGTFYSSGSSIEYKQDVEPYSPTEGALMSLKPVQYQYKDEWKDFGKRYVGNSSKQLGLVAEDVAKVLPELAVTKTEDGKEVVRNVDYEKLTVLLVSEVQKLRTELNEIKNN